MRQKRFLSWFLTLCLSLGMFSFPAYAEGNTTTISGDGTAGKTGTMTVTLVIPKKTPAATDLTYTAPTNLVYDGNNKAAAVAAASGVTGLGAITVKYYSDASRTTEATPKNVGTYYVGATVAEGDQYAASKAVLYGDGWTFSITASTPSAPAAPTKASATKNSVTLNAVSGCEYSKDGASWQDSTEFAGLAPGTEYTFYQRVKATANANASAASSAKFSTEADTHAMTITLVIKAAQTIAASDVTATYGETGKSVSASVTEPATGGGAISYAVKEGSGEYIDVAADGKLTIKKVPPTDGKAYVIAKAAATAGYAEATKEVCVTISPANVTVTAKNQGIYVGGTVPDLSSPVLDTHYTVSGLVGTDALTTAPTLAYQKDGSAATPVNTAAGTYDIVCSGASAGGNYAITYVSGTLTIGEKPAQTISAENVTATYGDTGKSVSASVTDPATGGGAVSYAVKDGSGDYIDVNASTGALNIKKVPADGKAYVTVTAAETQTHAAATKEVTVTISPKAMTVSDSGYTGYYDGQPHGITVTVTDPASGYTVKYGTVEGTYDQTVSPTQTEAGTKTVYYQVTADNYTTKTGSATVTINARQTQTITASDVTATYGDTGKSVSASVTEPATGGGEISYAVKSGDAVTVDEHTGALTIVKAGSAVITVTAKETATYAKATKDVTVTIGPKAMTVSAADVTATVDGQPHGITVTVTDPASGYTVKYGTEAGSYTLDASPTQTEAGTKTVYYQVTADNYTTYAGSAKVTINARQTQTISAENVTATYGDTDKKVTAATDGNGAISYAVKDGSGDYIDVGASTGALTIKKVPADGKAYVTVTASETATYAQATRDVTVTVVKATPTVIAPKPKDLTYTGSAQELVTAGTATGGEMCYELGTDAVNAPSGMGAETSIPTGTDAGTYYVWYKVVGDGNHKDTEPKPVTVTIAAKATATAKVTFKVANGEWNAGGNQEVPVTLTGEDGGKPVLKPADFPAVGNAPAEGFKEGSWDPAKPTADTELKDGETLTYTYTYAPKGTVRATVTFRVKNGSWDDGKADDVTVTLTGREGDELRLSADQIPAVGGKPDAGFKAGSWDVTPSTDTVIAKDTTYTYTYAAKGGPTPTPTPTPTPSPVPAPVPVPVPDPYARPYRGRSGSYYSTSTSTSSEPAVERAGMHRMFNPATGEHFYTASDAERDDLVGKGWNYEGIAFYVPKKSNTPVWRLFNPATGEHYYTTDADERDRMLGEGWVDEGVAWYADDAQGKAMYRLFDPKANPVASHHFTSSEAERQELVAAGWTDQGIGFYALG